MNLFSFNFFITILMALVFLYSCLPVGRACFFGNLLSTQIGPKYIFIASLIAIVSYVPVLTFAKALMVGKLGVVTPIAGSAVMFSALFSVLFFGESITIAKLIPISLIVLGIIMNSGGLSELSLKDFLVSSGIGYALVSCVLWGFSYCVIKIPVTILGPVLTSLIIESGIMICGAINMKIIKESFCLPNKRDLKCLILVGLSGGIASLFFNLGIGMGEVSIVAAIFSSNPLVSTLYGKFFLKEKLSKQQWFSAVLILIGIVLIFNL